jgi:trehalose 6-phosphate phosphatase
MQTMNNKIKAAILDLDGVITQTASIHANAWKKLFDEYNLQRKEANKSTYPEFSIEKDYKKYLDGKPRYEGVNSFLQSKNIELPYGNKEDDPQQETICGLGNRKNEFFQEALEEKGVSPFPDTIEKIKEWKAKGLKVAVISSSKNCKPVLKSAGIIDLFDAIVDGVESEKRNIAGKPEPDIFLEAARELQVDSQQAFIVEDAIAGVKAGAKGDFALVVGMERDEKLHDKLKENGADKVVASLKELNITE